MPHRISLSYFLSRPTSSTHRNAIRSVSSNRIPRTLGNMRRWPGSPSVHIIGPLTTLRDGGLNSCRPVPLMRVQCHFKDTQCHQESALTLAQASFASGSQDEAYSSNKSVSSLGRSSITSCPQAIVRVLQPFIF